MAEAELQIFTDQIERNCVSGISDLHRPGREELRNETSDLHRPGRAEVQKRNFSSSKAR